MNVATKIINVSKQSAVCSQQQAFNNPNSTKILGASEQQLERGMGLYSLVVETPRRGGYSWENVLRGFRRLVCELTCRKGT